MKKTDTRTTTLTEKIGTTVKHFHSPTGFATLSEVNPKYCTFSITSLKGNPKHSKDGVRFRINTHIALEFFK